MKKIYKQDERTRLVPEAFSSGAKRLFTLVAALLLRTEGQRTSGRLQRNSRPRQKGFVNVPLKKARNFPK